MPMPRIEQFDALEHFQETQEVQKETPFSCFNQLEQDLRRLDAEDFNEAREVRKEQTLLSIYCNEHAATLYDVASRRLLSVLGGEDGERRIEKQSLARITEQLSVLQEKCSGNNLDNSWAESFQGDKKGEWDYKKVSSWALQVYEFHRQIFDKKEREVA